MISRAHGDLHFRVSCGEKSLIHVDGSIGVVQDVAKPAVRRMPGDVIVTECETEERLIMIP